jgi:hypothetical protein
MVPTPPWSRGLDQERARNWAGAIEVYRDAVERWLERDELGRVGPPSTLSCTRTRIQSR